MSYRFYNNICLHCGDTFTAQRPEAKYCTKSSKCRTAAYRARRAAERTGLEGFTGREVEDLSIIRQHSEKAFQAVLHARQTFGLAAARCALWASWCIYYRDDVDPAECPYQVESGLLDRVA